MIDRVLSHYRILSELGGGGMGIVYLARDERLERTVAIKLLPPALTLNPEAKARFLREARTASALDHPNICAIHEIDETEEGQLYLVMPYYEGETLEQRIAAGALPAGEAIGVVAQVADGLAFAHARGIVHRDIKPSNVMVTREGVVKVLDFGLAKVVGSNDLSRTGASVGTPSFMSPEQVTGLQADHRSDLWSLGVVLQTLLTGRSPFAGDQVAAVLYAVMNRDPEPLSASLASVPEGLQEIVSRCLQRDPALRSSNAAGLAADLRRVLHGLYPGDPARGASASPVGAAQTALMAEHRELQRARRDRFRRLASASAVALVLVALGATGAAWLANRPPSVLRAGVIAPVVAGFRDSTEMELAATGTQVALVRGLAGLEGVAVVDPSELRGLKGGPGEIARALSTDALVTASLAGVGDEWSVTLRRLAGRDGHVEWTDAFTVSRDNPLLLADALQVHLRQGFRDRRPRSGIAAIKAGPAEYQEYLNLSRGYRAAGAANIPEPQMLERLDALRQRAPDFLEGVLLDASYTLYRFTLDKSPELLRRSAEAAERARRIAPDDPRPVAVAFNVALQSGELSRAATLLEAMRRLDPGNIEIDANGAALAERQGQPEKALSLMRDVVARRPSRYYLKVLADMEYRLGRIDEARAHLDTLRVRYPDDLFPPSKLAQLELLYGSAARADTLYRDLSRRAPKSLGHWVNRGLALMLLGRFAESSASMREGLARSPDNSGILLNLADCEALQGHHEHAQALYQRVLELVARDPAASVWNNQLIRAQCLAHLGRTREAVAAAQEAVRQAPENSEALYQASLVYALAGDRASAVVNAQKALEKGVQARWFGLPWFDTLRQDAEFRRALAAPQRIPPA